MQVWLLSKTADVERRIVSDIVAGFDVAIAGFWAGGLNAQDHHVVTCGGERDTFVEGLQKTRLVGNDMVGRKDAEDGAGILAFDEESGESAGRGGVAGYRLLDDLVLGNAGKLFSDLVSKVLVGDDPGFVLLCQGLKALNGLLDHGALTIERQNLLGVSATGAWPE